MNFLREWIPMDCPLCGGKSFDGTPNMFCSDCFSSFPFVKAPACPSCGGELNGILDICSDCAAEKRRPWKEAYAVFRMDGTVKNLIHSYKYRNRPELARAMGRLAAGRLMTEEAFHADVIVPTPLHWLRYLWRGFNQAELLSGELSGTLGIPCEPLLRRVRHTRRQAKLTRNERIANLNDAFCAIDSTKCKGRAILLVDDVMTTGSTLAAASRVLLDAGAAEVSVLVMARRQRN